MDNNKIDLAQELCNSSIEHIILLSKDEEKQIKRIFSLDSDDKCDMIILLKAKEK